jgi:hypothetical protein
MIYTNATAVPRDELSDLIMEAAGRDEMFPGLILLPELPVEQMTAHVPKIAVGSGDLMRATRKRRTPGTHFDRWQSAITDYSLTLVQVAEEVVVPDETTLAYENYFPVESVYTMEAASRLRLGLDFDQEGALFDSGTFTATNSLVAYTAANIATIDFVGDVINAIRRIKAKGERPNTIAIPGPVYDRLRQSTILKAWIAGSINPGDSVSPDAITASFKSMGITRTIVLDSYVNNSDAGNADVIDAVWPNTYVFVGSVQSGALKSGGVGRTFYWEKMGPLFNVSTYRDETRLSNIIRAIRTALPGITNARAGQLITTQYS